MPATLKRRAYEENGAVLRLSLDVGAPRPETLRVLPEDSAPFEALAVGEPLDEDTLAALRGADARYTAHLRALRLLAYSDHSARALTRKLREKGVDPETARDTAAWVLARGYIREEEQAYRIAVTRANTKRHGRHRVLAFLVEKGYSPDTARAAIRRAEEEGEIDFPAIAASLVADKLGEEYDEEEKRRLLYKHGF